MGPYQETFEGRRGVGGTILEVRSTSKAGSMTVFQDLRVFSYDRVEKQLRCRQFAFGAVATYDVEVSTGGQKVVLTEEHFEGGTRAPWRYTYTAISKKGFSYAVHTKRGDVWRPYVSGTLKRAPQK
jgi:hypothetical protein